MPLHIGEPTHLLSSQKFSKINVVPEDTSIPEVSSAKIKKELAGKVNVPVVEVRLNTPLITTFCAVPLVVSLFAAIADAKVGVTAASMHLKSGVTQLLDSPKQPVCALICCIKNNEKKRKQDNILRHPPPIRI
jgi:hypothetical protein